MIEMIKSAIFGQRFSSTSLLLLNFAKGWTSHIRNFLQTIKEETLVSLIRLRLKVFTSCDTYNTLKRNAQVTLNLKNISCMLTTSNASMTALTGTNSNNSAKSDVFTSGISCTFWSSHVGNTVYKYVWFKLMSFILQCCH